MRSRRIFIAVLLLSLIASFGCSKKFKMRRESLERPTSWQYYHSDTQSTGNKSGSFSGKLNVIWERSFRTRPSGPMTLAKGLLIFPDSKKKLLFYESATGEGRGFLRTKGYTSTGMVVKDSLGYYVDGPRRFNLHCVNLLKRKTLWEHQVKDATSGSIIVDNKLIISLTEGNILAYNLITGEKQWSFEAKERFLAPPSAIGNTVIQSADNGKIYFLNVTDGSEENNQKFDSPVLSASAVHRFVYTIDMDGKIIAMDPNDYTQKWQAAISGPVWGSPAVDDNQVYVTNNVGEIYAFDAASGATAWNYFAGEVINCAPIVVGSYVVFGTKTGKLYSLNTTDGSLVASRQLTGGISYNPISDGRFIYVASDNGELICLGDSNEIAALNN